MARLSVFDRKPPLSLLTAGELLDLANRVPPDGLQPASTPEVRLILRLGRAVCGAAALRELEERRATRH